MTGTDESFMLHALVQAKLAASIGEVPIGAVITLDNKIIAQSYNQVELKNDACCHAEILAIQEASKNLNSWRLENCTIYITLEPCPMCLGAIRLARIRRVVIGALESRMGAISKFPDLANEPALGPVPQIESGVLQQECQLILKDFFQTLRKK